MKRQFGNYGHLRQHRLKLLMMTALLLLLSAPVAFAEGTASGVSIDNQAVISYSVGGVAQTSIESSPTGNATPGAGAPTRFLVDDRVMFTVSTVDVKPVTVSPGGSGYVMTFVVSNTGNTTHDFLLTPAVQSNGTYTVWTSPSPINVIDNFDATTAQTFVEGDAQAASAGYVAATWNGNESAAAYVDELQADHSKTVYIVISIPATQVDGDASVYGLVAQAAAGGAVNTQGAVSANDTGADDPAVVQIVLGDSAGTDDAAKDGRHSSRSACEVAASRLTVSKAAAVVWDPFNLGTNPKAIPGAYIEYTVTITNNAAAAAPAAAVSLTDNLSTEISAGTIVFHPDSYGGGSGINVTAPGINSGALLNLTNVGSDDQGDWNVSTANTVTVNCGNLDAGESAIVHYQVVVQ